MSTPIILTIDGKTYKALPPSFAFQKQYKEKMHALQAGQMTAGESQDFIAEYIIHCIKRATPDADVNDLENRLDAVAIAQASATIGAETQKQIAKAYGVENLGEAEAGEA